MTKKDLCEFCGEPVCSFAGDTRLWPLWFSHPDGSGIVKPHHTGCVQDRLFGRATEPTQLRDPYRPKNTTSEPGKLA
jgi:hypothetical protein